MINMFNDVRVAFSFLTRLPVAPRSSISDATLGRSMAWFPMVGVVLGLALVGMDLILQRFFSGPLCNGLLLLFLILATGAMHIDGLADFCDSFGAGSDRVRALQIMKDSRLGTFGVVGVCMGLGLKILALMALPLSGRGVALLGFPVVGRWVVVLLAWALPYARSQGGIGHGFVQHVGSRQAVWATLGAVVIFALFFQTWGLCILGVMGLGAYAIGWYFKRRFGGVTGDLLGAALEGTEIVTILLLGVRA